MEKKILLFIGIPALQTIVLVVFLLLFKGNIMVWLGMGAIFVLFSFLVDFSLIQFHRQVEENKILEEKIEELNNVRQKEMDYGKISLEHIEGMERICENLEKELADNALSLAGRNDDPRREAAAEIIENMEKMLYESRFRRYCQNDVVNALLDAKMKEAQGREIDFQVECKVPYELNRDEIEICSLFENMIDASFLVAQKVQTEERAVSFKASEKAGMIVLKATMEIKNPECRISANDDKGRRSARRKLWGAELELAERICKNNKGSFTMNMEEGELQIIAIA